jgi:hypothetical protein
LLKAGLQCPLILAILIGNSALTLVGSGGDLFSPGAFSSSYCNLPSHAKGINTQLMKLKGNLPLSKAKRALTASEYRLSFWFVISFIYRREGTRPIFVRRASMRKTLHVLLASATDAISPAFSCLFYQAAWFTLEYPSGFQHFSTYPYPLFISCSMS